MSTAGFLPIISYGPSVLGASSHEIKRMRREMCASALTHRAGRCPYTVSSIVYDRKDPLPLPAQNLVGGMDLFRKSSATHPASMAPYLFAYFGGPTLETHMAGKPTTRSLDFTRRHHVHLVRSCAPFRPQSAFPPLRGHPLGRFLAGG